MARSGGTVKDGCGAVGISPCAVCRHRGVEGDVRWLVLRHHACRGRDDGEGEDDAASHHAVLAGAGVVA